MRTTDSGHTIVVFKTNLCHVFSFYKLLWTHKDILFIADSRQQRDAIQGI